MDKKYVTIREAAEFLGVTPLTLRNWDKNGKLKASRHPMSNYRVYKMESLEKVIKDIETGTVLPRPPRQSSGQAKKPTVRKLIVKYLED